MVLLAYAAIKASPLEVSAMMQEVVLQSQRNLYGTECQSAFLRAD
jgi:hypothetical protein